MAAGIEMASKSARRESLVSLDAAIRL
jgi:hypothetical protein